jgi:hypothetical protein
MVERVMNTNDFPIGSRVRIKRHGFPEFGTVVAHQAPDLETPFIGVKLDEYRFHASALDGHVEQGWGYWFNHGIEPYNPPSLKQEIQALWEPLL